MKCLVYRQGKHFKSGAPEPTLQHRECPHLYEGTAHLTKPSCSTSLPPTIDTRTFRPRSCKQRGRGSAHRTIPIPATTHPAGCTLHPSKAIPSTLTAFSSRKLRMDPSKCLLNSWIRTESLTLALFSSKRMSGFPLSTSLMLRGLLPLQAEHCGNWGGMEVAAGTPHTRQAGDWQSSGRLSQPHSSTWLPQGHTHPGQAKFIEQIGPVAWIISPC